MSANYETSSVSVTMQGVVAFIHRTQPLDENPRKRRILRTLHRLYLASSLPRIQFRSFLGVSMFLPASLSASFLILPYLARGGLPLPGASRRPPMPPSSNRATHSWTVRRSTSAKYAASFVGYPAHRHHPVADPGILLCTHGLRQLPDLLVSLVHGWLTDLVIKKLFCLTALQEAKLFASMTLVIPRRFPEVSTRCQTLPEPAQDDLRYPDAFQRNLYPDNLLPSLIQFT